MIDEEFFSHLHVLWIFKQQRISYWTNFISMTILFFKLVFLEHVVLHSWFNGKVIDECCNQIGAKGEYLLKKKLFGYQERFVLPETPKVLLSKRRKA